MKRYTRYFKHCMAVDKNGTKHYQEGIYIENGGDRKLFDLENLEEELGLDLITVFKALSSWFAIRQKDGSIQVSEFNHRLRKKAVAIDEDKNKLIEEYCIMRGDGDFMLKDYGKTWALTKEELGKEETPVEEKLLVDFYKAVDPIKWWLKHNCSFIDATVIAQKKDGNITIDFQFEEK